MRFIFSGSWLICLLCTGLIDLAIKNNCLIGGDDFKSGQTKMKSVLVDFLVGAGIKVPTIYQILWLAFRIETSIFFRKLFFIYNLIRTLAFVFVAHLNCQLQPLGE